LRHRYAQVRRRILEDISSIRMVSSIELDKIPDDRVVNDIEGKDLTIESFFLQNYKKNKEI